MRSKRHKGGAPPLPEGSAGGASFALADWQCRWRRSRHGDWELESCEPTQFLGHKIVAPFSPQDWLFWVSREQRRKARRLLATALDGKTAAGELAFDHATRGRHRVRLVLTSERLGERTYLHLAAVDRGEMIEPLLAGMIEQLLASFDQPDSLERLCAAVAEVLGARWVQLWEERGSFGLRLLAQWGLSAEEERALRGTVLPPGTLAENAQRMTAITGRAARISGEAARAPAELFQLVLPRGQGNSGLLVAALRRQRESTRAAQLDRAAVERLAAVWFAHASLLRELDEATRLKSDFVSTMSHELRTPLNTLIGYTELLALEEFGPLTAEQREVLERMDHSARELLGLINTTLDLNRFEQQTEPLILESVDIRALIEELEREVVGTCQRRGLAFRSTIAPGITQMRTDRPKLKAILQHLLSNAIKFTEQGSVGIEVRASSGGLEFTVFDTGIGIDTDILPIIFEPFRQGERASTRRFGGVGLGLYIVRRLVEMMGGQVQVESQPGQGSQFRVWVPDRAIPPSSSESAAEPQS